MTTGPDVFLANHRVCFFDVAKLLILERETGLEPATSSLGN